MYTNYPIELTDDTASGRNISLLLNLNEFYTVSIDSVDFCFKVTAKASIDLVNIVWIQLDGDPTPALKPSTLPVSTADIKRGFSSTSNSIYKINYLRRGYLDIDSIVFDLFYRKISKWTWNSPTHISQFEDVPTKFVDFFFFNKRPITRQPYAEQTLGAVDNVDQSWQNSKESSNPTSIKTMPFLTFQPLGILPTGDELYRVEEFYRYLESVPQAHFSDFDDIEMYQPPQLYEFSYQITAVTDSWKDCRLLQAHLMNSMIPLDRGERYILFPSGMTHSVTVEPSEIIPNEDEGVFETTVTYIFKLPLIDSYPEFTYSWVTGTVFLDNTEPVTPDLTPEVPLALEVNSGFGDLWGYSGEVEW